MKNVGKFFATAVLISIPNIAIADIDLPSYLVSLVKQAQKDGIGKINENAMSELQEESKDLVSDKYSNIDPSKIKDAAKDAIDTANKELKLDDKIPGEFTGIINGVGSNPLMRTAAKKIFTVGKRSGDDVEKNKQLEEMTNELMIENVSSMYARGLVRRYQLDNEKKEKVDDFNNIKGVQAVFVNTVYRANNRWMSMLQQEAGLMSQTSMKQMTAIRPDEVDNKAEDKEQTEE